MLELTYREHDDGPSEAETNMAISDIFEIYDTHDIYFVVEERRLEIPEEITADVKIEIIETLLNCIDHMEEDKLLLLIPFTKMKDGVYTLSNEQQKAADDMEEILQEAGFTNVNDIIGCYEYKTCYIYRNNEAGSKLLQVQRV